MGVLLTGHLIVGVVQHAFWFAIDNVALSDDAAQLCD
jgi:hypothetical protein